MISNHVLSRVRGRHAFAAALATVAVIATAALAVTPAAANASVDLNGSFSTTLVKPNFAGSTCARGVDGNECGFAIAARSDATALSNGPIAFGRFDPDLRDFSLWTARADGSHQRRLTTVPSFFSDWAPDGSGLIFDYVDGPDEHIATIDRDGSHLTQLTFGPGIQEVPRYSPDGQQVVFDASTLLPDDPAFTTNIWVMSSDGSHPRQVTHGGFDVEPAYSPDGRHIVFGRIVGPASPTDFTQNEAVYVVRTDGTGLHQVIAPRPGLEHPRWSPDGRLLTFNIAPEAAGAPGAGSIYSVRTDGQGLDVIRAASRAWNFTKAVWSPDGLKMLVTCHRVVANIDYICQMSPQNGHIRVVVTTPLDQPVNFPSWGRSTTEGQSDRSAGAKSHRAALAVHAASQKG